MADSRIQDLTPATKILPQDLFVLEQNGEAKNLSGQVLVRDLLKALDGHGGIKTPWQLTSSDGLVDTYEAELADGTKTRFTVTNGESGVQYGPDEPSSTQDVWVVMDEQQSDEAFAELDARYAKNDTAVLTNPQELSPEQKAQARINIDVRSNEENDQRYSPALTRTVQGEVIAVDDVSPLKHEVKCTVSGAPDLSAVTVSRYGDNIIPLFIEPQTIHGMSISRSSDGGIILNGTADSDFELPLVSPDTEQILPAGKYIAYYSEVNSDKTTAFDELFVAAYGFYVKNQTYRIFTTPGTYPITAKSTRMTFKKGNTASNVIVHPQLVAGDQRRHFGLISEFETFTPSPDGVVYGMTALSLNMTILTDTPGALLNVTYNADPMTIIDKLTQRVADLESAQAQI